MNSEKGILGGGGGSATAAAPSSLSFPKAGARVGGSGSKSLNADKLSCLLWMGSAIQIPLMRLL